MQAVKTIACGTPDVSGVFVVTLLVCQKLILRTRLRPHGASGVPRALMLEGERFAQSSGAIAPRERGRASIVIASEAKQSSAA